MTPDLARFLEAAARWSARVAQGDEASPSEAAHYVTVLAVAAVEAERAANLIELECNALLDLFKQATNLGLPTELEARAMDVQYTLTSTKNSKLLEDQVDIFNRLLVDIHIWTEQNPERASLECAILEHIATISDARRIPENAFG